MTNAPFVHLHFHTDYPLLDGACEISHMMDVAPNMIRFMVVKMAQLGRAMGLTRTANHHEQQGARTMRRRQFLTFSVTAVGGLLVYTLDRQPLRVHAQQGNRKLRVPLRFFDEREALIATAATARIFPSDAAGPGAPEAAVVIYIDRQLAGPYGRDKHRYTQPPFEDGIPEQGYQGKATPREAYREGLARLGQGSTNCPPKNKMRNCEPSNPPTSFSSCANTPSKECSAIRCTAATRT